MVDRVWWKWQNANAANQNSFLGGSVQNLTSLASYTEYPNGAPPLLSMASLLPTDGILPEGITLGDVWDVEGDLLCYTYDS